MKRSKFEASELSILIRIGNELRLLAEEKTTLHGARQILLAQANHIKTITRNHGAVPNYGGIKNKKNVTEEWPNNQFGIHEALK